MRKWWMLALAAGLVLVSVAAGQDPVGAEEAAAVVEGATTPEIDWNSLLQTALPALVAAILWILERLGKKKMIEKLKGAIEVGRVVFAAVEEAEAGDVKKIVANTMTEPKVTDAAKEIQELLHASVSSKKAESVPPIKRFWRRFLAGENLAGVAARMAGKQAVTNWINDNIED